MSRQRRKLFTGSPGPADIITVDQTYTLSDTDVLISGDVAGAHITRIRANSHNFLGKHTGEQQMTICQLSDINRNYFYDGTPAVLTGSMGDVFMRLAPDFHWKVLNPETELTNIGLAHGRKPDETWHTWDPGQLIGVYKGYMADSKLYSRSGVAPAQSVSQVNARAYARNRGTGFHCVTWEWHSIMIPLFYALYGTVDCQAQCGYGSNPYLKTTGSTDSLGMRDTDSSNGNTNGINFFGLENWWGDTFEVIDNAILNNAVLTITDPITGETVRAISGIYTKAQSGYSWLTDYKHRTITEFLDFYTAEGQQGFINEEGKGFHDGFIAAPGENLAPLRSCSRNYFEGGVANISICYSTTYTSNNSTGSRLAFTGEVIVEEDPERFKSLTAIS